MTGSAADGSNGGGGSLTPLLPRSTFVGLDNSSVHLAAGLESPMMVSHAEVFSQFSLRKSRGAEGRQELLDEYISTRRRAASLLGVDDSWIGFSYNVGHFMNHVANSLRLERGDNVLVMEGEFPSVIYPWLQQRQRGVDVVVVPQSLDPQRELENVAERVDQRTRAIVISHSCYLRGTRRDLRGFRLIADEVGAALVVDSSHTLGSIGVDGTYADFLVSACYKWLFGVHGVALSMWNKERQPDWIPSDVGWASVSPQDWEKRGREPYSLVSDGRVFELGNPSLLGVHILGNALSRLDEIGISAIEEHNLAISGYLLSELSRLPIHLLTPFDDSQRAANVSFSVKEETAWKKFLQDAGIIAAVGLGRVRFSTHLYNSTADADRASSAVEAALKAGVE